MKEIINNPYRVLGVYSNSPTRERVANKGKMNAFLKVGKEVTFDVDFPILGHIQRSMESVAEADSELTLSADQLRHAQFWYVKATSLDDTAFHYLTEGNIAQAINTWHQEENVSSLQNAIISELLQQQWIKALHIAEELYSKHANEFTALVFGENTQVDATEMWHYFLDTLSSVTKIQPDDTSIEEWKKYLNEQSIAPLIAKLDKALQQSKGTRKSSPKVRLKSGQELYDKTEKDLKALEKIISNDDIRYQTIADSIGLEILQCAIDYYNQSYAPKNYSVASHAHWLALKACWTVVGQMATDRCKENYETLGNVCKKLRVGDALKTIKEAIDYYYRGITPEKDDTESEIDKSSPIVISLLNMDPIISEMMTPCEKAKNLKEKTEGELEAIKCEWGEDNENYINLSSNVVNAIISLITLDTNEAVYQYNEYNRFGINTITPEKPIRRYYSNMHSSLGLPTLSNDTRSLQETLREAWDILCSLMAWDMVPELRESYKKNKKSLEELCSKADMSYSEIYSIERKYTQKKKEKKPKEKVDDIDSEEQDTEKENRLIHRLYQILEISLFVTSGILWYKYNWEIGFVSILGHLYIFDLISPFEVKVDGHYNMIPVVNSISSIVLIAVVFCIIGIHPIAMFFACAFCLYIIWFIAKRLFNISDDGIDENYIIDKKKGITYGIISSFFQNIAIISATYTYKEYGFYISTVCCFLLSYMINKIINKKHLVHKKK